MRIGKRKWERSLRNDCYRVCVASSYTNSVFNIHEMKVRERPREQSHFPRDLTASQGCARILQASLPRTALEHAWNVFS